MPSWNAADMVTHPSIQPSINCCWIVWFLRLTKKHHFIWIICIILSTYKDHLIEFKWLLISRPLLSSYLIKIITKPSDIHCHSYISKTAKVRPQQQRTRQQQCTLRSIATCGGPLLSRPWVLNDGQAEDWSAPTWIYLEKHGGFPLFYLPFVGVGVMVAIQFDQVDVHPKQKVIDLELDDVRVRRTYLLPYLLPLCSLPFQQLVSIHLLHKPGKKPLDIHEKRQNKGGGGGTTIQKRTMENQHSFLSIH